MAFLAALKNEYPYDFNPQRLPTRRRPEDWDDLLACKNRGPIPPTDMVAQISADDLRPANADAVATLHNYLQKTSLPLGPTQAPMLVIYGGQDPVIPVAWTDSALRRACKMGDTIQIDFGPDAAHDRIDAADALGWIGDRFRSIPPRNDCGTLTPS